MTTLTVVQIKTSVLPEPQEGQYDLKDRAFWIEVATLPSGATGTMVNFVETDNHTTSELYVEELFADLMLELPTFAELEIVQINSSILPTPKTLGVNIAKMAKQPPTTFKGSAASKIYLHPHNEHTEGKQLVTLDTIPQGVLDLC